MKPSKTLLIIALPALLLASTTHAQKLYRWVDADGKVHYTDALPPEAVDSAREELNQQGMAVSRVERALTDDERAALSEERAKQAEMAALQAEKDKMDAVLIGSYPSEVDLQRAYAERFDLLDQSVEAARVGIRSQEKSLTDLLAHAANIEREGRPVPATVASSINAARKQVADQRAFLAKRETERESLQKEFDTVLERYRGLKAGAVGSQP